MKAFLLVFLFLFIIFGLGGGTAYCIIEYFGEQSSIINALGIGLICASVVCVAFWLWLVVARWLCLKNR